MRLSKFFPLLRLRRAAQHALVARIRPYLPGCLRRHRYKELQLVRWALTKAAVGVHMVWQGHVLLGPMTVAAAMLFWILAERLVNSRRRLT